MKNSILKLLIALVVITFFMGCRKKASDKIIGSFDKIHCDTTNCLPDYDQEKITILDEKGNHLRDSIIKIKKSLSVFIPCRQYIYSTKFFDKDKNILAHGHVLIMALGKRWKYDKTQDAVLIKHKYNTAEQKKVIHYFKNQDYPVWGWQEESHTGIIENDNKIWTHPFRDNQYILTEIAPFPMIKYPMKVGKVWNNTLSIGKGWGIWSKTNGRSYYEVIGKEKLSLSFTKEEVSCFKISAKGSFDFGVSYLTYYFSKQYGFVKEEYQFYNGEKLTLDLVNIR